MLTERAASAAVPPFDQPARVSARPARARPRVAALRNFTWLMLDKALAVAFGLAVFGLIARWLGPVASGHFAYGLALLQGALGLSMVCSAAVLVPGSIGCATASLPRSPTFLPCGWPAAPLPRSRPPSSRSLQ
jgi:hypothetical protein